MPEAKTIRIYYEGDDDRAILERLQASALLPANWQIAARDKKHPGKDGVIQDLLPFANPAGGVGGEAVVLIDLDDQTPETVRGWLLSVLQRSVSASQPPVTLTAKLLPTGRVSVCELSAAGRTGTVALIPVGLPEDAGLRQRFGVERFAIDDYLLRLVTEREIYEAISDFKDVPFDTASVKLLETARLLRSNQIPVLHCKRFLHLLRAITAFRPSSATFAERVTRKALESPHGPRVQQLLRPLLDDLTEAAAALNPMSISS